MSDVVERALAAHGGRKRWAAAAAVTARFDASGLLFGLKRRKPQIDAAVTVHLGAEQHVELDLADGAIGVLDGRSVEVRDRAGAVVGRREDARAHLTGRFRAVAPWDDIDFTYFAAGAWWTYLLGPMAWIRPDVELSVLDDHTVDARYDRRLATHCERQRFHLDAEGRIIRHDYTPNVISGLARANHRSSNFVVEDGLSFAATRRVTPAGLPIPTLVALDVHSVSLLTTPPRRGRAGGGS